MAPENDQDGLEDADLQRVLKSAGQRPQPSPEMLRSVHAAVHAEWQDVVAKRRRVRRRWVSLAAAASVLLVLSAAWLMRPSESSAPLMANVARSIGVVEVKQNLLKPARALQVLEAVRVGDIVSTGPTGRAAIALAGGASVRLDHDTRIQFTDAERLVVRAGAIYVDTQGTRAQLRVDTPGGSVRHVGTQYEVRLIGDQVRIRVREGRIELTDPDRGAQLARAGEELRVLANGALERASIPIYGAEWAWSGSAAPAIPIDGRPLSEFLAWAGRELGREVVFATREDELLAGTIILNGSIEGLAPAQALATILATTQFRSVQRGGELLIAADSAPR